MSSEENGPQRMGRRAIFRPGPFLVMLILMTSTTAFVISRRQAAERAVSQSVKAGEAHGPKLGATRIGLDDETMKAARERARITGHTKQRGPEVYQEDGFNISVSDPNSRLDTHLDAAPAQLADSPRLPREDFLRIASAVEDLVVDYDANGVRLATLLDQTGIVSVWFKEATPQEKEEVIGRLRDIAGVRGVAEQ